MRGFAIALEAAVQFARNGSIGALAVEPRIHGDVLTRAAGGRAKELAARQNPPPRDPAASSIGKPLQS